MDKDFTELVQYLDQKFTTVDQRFDEIKNDYINLQTSVDVYAHKADAYFQEMVMMGNDLKMDSSNCR